MELVHATVRLLIAVVLSVSAKLLAYHVMTNVNAILSNVKTQRSMLL
jgi:hypothetical protein